jgi:cyclopropane-fatty-acyl-phospholipid synthase
VALAELFRRFVGPDAPIRFTAYDGSSSGPTDADVTLRVTSRDALRYLAHPDSDLGLARAYVTGALDIDGDVHAALTTMRWQAKNHADFDDKVAVARALGPQLLHRVEIPAEEAPPPWRRGLARHTKSRDAAAISHHYDVSNRFYEMVLGPSMAYTCATYPHVDSTLEEAQYAKFDLVARKLDLKPGMRLLDVGCGWGSMVIHAAQHYGVEALGVTLSRQQAEWAAKRIADLGLANIAEVRFLDYRDVEETGFDAVSSIGLTEHIGQNALPEYFSFLYNKLVPHGRMLNHCITRPNGLGRAKTGAFIDRYVFPDGELLGPGTIISAMHDAAFEVRHEENIREHYAMTLRDWGRNLEENWDECVAEVGERRARVWRLYMAGSRLGFDVNSIQLHQVLGVKLDEHGVSEMPLRPDWGV